MDGEHLLTALAEECLAVADLDLQQPAVEERPDASRGGRSRQVALLKSR